MHELYYGFKEHFLNVGKCLYAFPSDICVIGVQFLSRIDGELFLKQINSVSPTKKSWWNSFWGNSNDEEIVITQPTVMQHVSGMKVQEDMSIQYVGSLYKNREQLVSLLTQNGYTEADLNIPEVRQKFIGKILDDPQQFCTTSNST